MSSKPDPKPTETPSPIGEISQEPSAFESFLDANQKKLVIVGILAIIALVTYVVVDGLKQMTRREHAAKVAEARTVPEYEKVSKELEGETAGGSALLLKSKLLWRDQQQQEALDTVNAFISSYPEHPALGSAYASLGSYQQQLGELDEAKEAFKKSVETESAASSLSLLALGDLARDAGKNEEARTFYDRIITEYEDSHFQVKGLARQRIKLIGVESPTEKAPEPEEPGPGPVPAPLPNPGAFTPTPGLPGANPGIPPAPEPTNQPARTNPDDTPASGDAPATNETPADQPAGEETEATNGAASENEGNATGTPESEPASPEPAPAATEETTPAE